MLCLVLTPLPFRGTTGSGWSSESWMSSHCLCPYCGRESSLPQKAPSDNCLSLGVAVGWSQQLQGHPRGREDDSCLPSLRRLGWAWPCENLELWLWCSWRGGMKKAAGDSGFGLGGGKRLFIPMWLTPHHYKAAVLRMAIVRLCLWPSPDSTGSGLMSGMSRNRPWAWTMHNPTLEEGDAPLHPIPRILQADGALVALIALHLPSGPSSASVTSWTQQEDVRVGLFIRAPAAQNSSASWH